MERVPLPAGLENLIIPSVKDLGDGFKVRRALPTAERRMVGPFVFFDQMGPNSLAAGHGLDVRPHPHIGLATVTYLYSGEILHRDSLGTVQRIRPGEVNWMTAGQGITHSERSPGDLRAAGHTLFGIQTWIALPQRDEDVSPAFEHFAAERLPTGSESGLELRLIAGTLGGLRSPVPTFSEMFYADLQLRAGTRYAFAAEHEERAVHVAEGTLETEGGRFEAGTLLVLKPGAVIDLRAATDCKLLLLGGAALEGKRYVYWNFVSSSVARIEQAKADWREGRFAPVPEETEFIPLPSPDVPVANYP